MRESDAPFFVRRIFGAFDDPERTGEFVGAFAEDGRFRLGNVAPVVGRGALQDDLGGMFGAIEAIRHDIHEVWHQDGVILAEAEVDYWPGEGAHVKIPALIRIRMDGEEIGDMHVYMDRSKSHPFREEPEAL